MKLRPTLVAAVMVIFAGVSTAALAAADNAPATKPEAAEASQKAETAGKNAAPKKKPAPHSHTQEKTGAPPSTVAAADTPKKKTSKVQPHQHSRDAK